MSANVQIIGQRQFAWLICSLLTGGGLLSIQHEIFRIAKLDAWMTYLFPMIYALLVGYVLTRLAIRFPRKHLFEINSIVFGRFFGTFVNVVILLHFWFILMRTTKTFNQFIGTTLLPNTPPGILIMLFMLLLLFYGKTSVEVVARVNELFFPFFLLQILLSPIVLSNEIDRHLIQPVMTLDMTNYSFSSILGIGWFGDILVAGAFLHTLWSSGQLRTSLRHGIILSAVLLSLSMFMQLVVLGPVIPGNMIYPNYSLVQHIHITDFLDRVDLFILSIWYPITACKIILIYLAFLTGIASLFKQRDYSVINSPISLFLLLTTFLAFRSTTEVLSFENFSSPVIALSYQPLLLIILMIGARRFPITKETEHSPKAKEQGRQGGRGGRRNEVREGWLERRPPAVWGLLGNGLLALCVILSLMGLALGKSYALAGILCASGYALCLLIAFAISQIELKQTAKLNPRPPSVR
ncbi:spore germination protein (amino acid permease) [Paenibacillus sp. UNCCL117]|uniref:GerAB/ArcD/ProY family transporter n=1 Tax=unclassified Paenibacillus TaxID=185978 RepID=UPI000882498C|nr:MULTISPECIES: endospore germination permease [unclassified Paenibacillus]SDE30591.1 spore germination protein (amino acid permease) [Paenibacillus sp. cl123]SFW63054.1 spore germination protein (amino acid permease) [Paenibacillus sp. UNCCL117]